MGFTPFPPHWMGRIMGTAGDTIFIDQAAVLFHGKLNSEWNEGFFKSDSSKKRFVDRNGIKGSITKKSFWPDQWMLLKKID